ncbi:Protein CBG04099 [Caenorhabditis briggsae]|uniref:Major sperm protein n=1 Tax=Caenorhabditis briggsae TaxID=6238 RepID=A8WW76_CAEBR|nr:Protein CBG04099 [Caenorhabditis briggsae]CAP24885.2 Protein CBG04099 [Caenorhabditis briggsae]
MAFDTLLLCGFLIISCFWITVCGGKKKKNQKKPPGKSTETAKPLVVPDNKADKSKKSAKSNKKPEEKKEDKASDGNQGGPEKPHISADPPGPLIFRADQSAQSKVTLKNIHDKKVMFKLKLSDNVAFQVNPVFGVLEPGKTIDVAVTHRKSAPKEGKMVIVNTVLTGDEKKVAELFKQVTKPTGGLVTVKWIAK